MSKVKLMGKNQHIKSISGHKTGCNWYTHEPEVASQLLSP